jgi:hypothetical protein
MAFAPKRAPRHRNDVGVALPQFFDLTSHHYSDTLPSLFRPGPEHRGCAHRTFIEGIEPGPACHDAKTAPRCASVSCQAWSHLLGSNQWSLL